MGGPWRTLQFFQIIFRTMSFRVQHDEGRRQAFLDHIAAGISWIPRQRTTMCNSIAGWYTGGIRGCGLYLKPA